MSQAKKKAVPVRRTTRKSVAAKVALDLRKLIPGTKLPGGIFAGLIYPKGIAEALILGPEFDGTTDWNSAKKWAEKLTVGGVSGFSLPTRKEQSLLFANVGDQFKPNWYWSCEQHASLSDYAWGQGFGSGHQYRWVKDYGNRARAVRRLAI